MSGALTGAAPWALKAGCFPPRWCVVVLTAWPAVCTLKRIGGGLSTVLQGPHKNNVPFDKGIREISKIKEKQMKISGTPQLRPDPPVTQNRREAISADTDFQTILKQTVGCAAEKQAARVAHPLSVQSTWPVVSSDAEAVLPLTDRIDRLVDRLENYRLKLADPQVSLRSIQPLLNDMAASSEKLAPKLAHLDEADPLRDILNRSLVMVSLEITRFNRGDYL
jgi:hypothetical protein